MAQSCQPIWQVCRLAALFLTSPKWLGLNGRSAHRCTPKSATCSIEMLSRLGSGVGDARLVFQPTLQLIPSRWPIIDIWNAHQRKPWSCPTPSLAGRPTLRSRVWAIVSACRLFPPAGALRRGLARGLSLDAALRLAMARDRLFAPGPEVASLFGERIVTDVVPAQGESS